MAKRIKFPLEMKDGVMVRTIEELRENFDAEKLLTYFLNGKLQLWLKDRHYEEYFLAVDKIANTKNVLEKLCDILLINCPKQTQKVDIKTIQQKNEIINKMKQFTDEKDILDNLHLVARNQKELDKLIKQESKKIYLFGERFVCQSDIHDVCIEGINNPIVEIDSQEVIDFSEREVCFKNVSFDTKYQSLLDKKKYEEEHRNDKKRKPYSPSEIIGVQLSDGEREKSKILYNQLQEQLIDTKFDIDVSTKLLEQLLRKSNLEGSFSIDDFGKQHKAILKAAELDNLFYEFSKKVAQ